MVVVEVKSEEEFKTLLNSTEYKHTLVDFTAAWCPPCRMIAPVYTDLSNTYADLQFLKVDVDRLSSVSKGAGVTAMPTFICYTNGQKSEKFIRGANKSALESLVKSLSSPEQAEKMREAKKEQITESISNSKDANKKELDDLINTYKKPVKVQPRHMFIVISIFFAYFLYTIYESSQLAKT